MTGTAYSNTCRHETGITTDFADPVGYSQKYAIERLYRYAPMLLLGEGTAEVQEMIIGRLLLDRLKETVHA